MSEITTSSEVGKLNLEGQEYELPVITGTENERAIDVSKLRATNGYITLDSGYGNTGSCKSAITFIDGEKGILRYRGYPIEQLAEKSSFMEVCWLLIYGELPTQEQLDLFNEQINENSYIHEGLRHCFDGFPSDSHPMAILSAMINALGCYQKELLRDGEENFDLEAVRLISKVSTITAFTFRMLHGRAVRYPKPHYSYSENFLHMMFSKPYSGYVPSPEITKAIDVFFLLHADHEQNCSTSTVRMVGSSRANLFASVSAGVCALWGPLHGGANMAVLKMLDEIHGSGKSIKQILDMAKDKSAGFRLMGFGHRVYKNFDPRAKILGKLAGPVLDQLGVDDPLLDIARELEQAALADEYFVERKLYPNVDFYSGIILRALGIPIDMFTVMFAIGRMPGWIAHWREMTQEGARIYRPRQIYTGENERDYVGMENR